MQSMARRQVGAAERATAAADVQEQSQDTPRDGGQPAGRRRPEQPQLEEHPASIYDKAFTRDELHRLMKAATAPLLDEEVRLLQVLIRRVATNGQDPAFADSRGVASATAPPGDAAAREDRRAILIAKLRAVGQAVDVLQRTLKTRHALASASADAIWQLLDEVAEQMCEGPTEEDAPGEEGAR